MGQTDTFQKWRSHQKFISSHNWLINENGERFFQIGQAVLEMYSRPLIYPNTRTCLDLCLKRLEKW